MCQACVNTGDTLIPKDQMDPISVKQQGEHYSADMAGLFYPAMC